MVGMTEDQHIKLVEVGNSFWEELGHLAARHIARMSEETEHETIMYLQDKCSVYSTKYDEILPMYRRGQKLSGD